jgi:tetratricopeptide (TPR) repeat protein
MTPLKLLPLYAALMLTAACGQLGTKTSAPPVKEAEPAVADAAAEAAREATRDAEAEALAKARAALPRQPLTPELLLKFLVAEVAGQRGAIGVAQSTYLDLARQTRDPRVAQRAAEVSAFARDSAGALEATRLWVAAEQGSVRAQQTLAALLLSEGKLGEAEPILRTLLKENPANGFLHLAAVMGKMRDPVAALDLVERLATDHPQLPEAQFAVAQAAASAGRFDAALAALQKADGLRPGWEPGALLRAQVLARTSNAEALAFMRAFLAEHADAREVRLAYARTLISANQFTEARAEFTRLTRDFPRNAEVSFAAGLLSLQLGDLEAARELLTRTLEYNPRDLDTIHYYLGQTAEQMKRADAAAAHYNEVKSGNQFVPARARLAALLAQAGKHDEARALLAATEGQNDAQNVRLIQAQAELLRDSKAHTAIFDVLSDGLKRYPDAPDLLYDRAMAAEKLGKLDVLEADLRRVIALRPNDAQAYNALGYTLADRTPRLAEAVDLLDKALALAPEDPFILDSVGWAQYRSGNLDRARHYLERAYKARPDPEIAAHLGEVLWAQGRRDEAGKLWQASLQTHPRNEVLLETLRRLAH